jgi:xanthine/CO dehydrogenase XdhC/CoxF family maturation factor
MSAGYARAGMGGSASATLLGVALLAGCAGGDKLFTRAVAPPPPAQVEAGSTLTLKVPLTFPPDAGALYFQDSQIVELVSLARDLPYCALAPASPSSPRRLEPRTFAVRSVEYDDRRSAATGQTADVTRIALAANAAQPYTLTCQWPPGAPSQSFLTSDEIEGAIGGQFATALQR